MLSQNKSFYNKIIQENQRTFFQNKTKSRLLKMKLKSLFYHPDAQEIDLATFYKITDGFMKQEFIREIPSKDIFIGYKTIDLPSVFTQEESENSLGTSNANKVYFIINKDKPYYIHYFHDINPVRFYNEDYFSVDLTIR